MKALITGGAGFIGSHLAKKFLDNNIDVHIVDNLSTGKLENISFLKKDCFFYHDINDLEFMTQLLKKEQYDYILHLAAMVSVVETIEKPIQSNQDNMVASVNLLDTIKNYIPNFKKFFFASSAAIYGQLEDLPKSINSKIDPLSPYAIQKYSSERYAKIYFDLYNVPTVSMRFFNIYGPKQNPNSDYSGVLSILNQKFIKKEPFTFFGDGEQTRDFVYINDLVDAVWLVINSKETNGKVYNLGTGKQTSLNEIFNIFKDNFGYSIPHKYEKKRIGDIKHSYAEISPLKKLGFNPNFSIKDGIREYLRT
ncbi:NAD-dependent epimerase/dehydratase family protein [Staphylococcus hominis]|uniref:NAD-dependent epimerase/dehydratase family protein n=1 Tax=Staphylococcus hominis TaxID=1290 RepID=UPI004035BDA6